MFTIPLPADASLLVSLPWSGLHPALQWPLLLAVVAAPLALLLRLYRYELRLVARGTAALLLGLRLAALAVILLLVCFQPIYARDRQREQPGLVLVAVDRSLSTDLADPQRPPAEKLRLARALGWTGGKVADDELNRWLRDHDRRRDPAFAPGRQAVHDELCSRVATLTRADLARLVLADDGLKLLAAIRDRHDIALVGFHREPFEADAAALPELFKRPEGTDAGAAFTDLHAVLTRALEQSGPVKGKVLGVVLLTDGQHNSGPSPAAKARELGERQVAVYPVALGPRDAPPDAALLSVRGPHHTVFKDVEAVVEVKVKITGLRAQPFKVELTRKGAAEALVAPKTIDHDGTDRVYTLAFPVRMKDAGTQTLEARVRAVKPLDKETRDDNNALATTISVADDKARVLLVEGEARWEFHYLATALARDRLIELKSVVFERPRVNPELSSKELEEIGLPGSDWPAGADPFGKYACVVLGDVDAARLPLARRQQLERYVADGGGTLIVVAGKRHMPLSFPETAPTGEADPLRRLLPIEAPRPLAPEAGFALSLTAAGRVARFMELDAEREDNDKLWAGFPRPWGWAVAGRAKPGATPLASWLAPGGAKQPLAERERDNAVVARHGYGFGRVLYVGLDSTWRWRYKAGDLYHHRFWGQVIRWAAADKPLVVGNEYVRFGTPQPVYRPGDVVDVVARLNDNLGALRPDLLVGGRVVRLAEGKDGREEAVALVPLGQRAGQPRVFEGKLRDLPAGSYALELALPDMADKLLAPAKPGAERRPLRALFRVLPPESRELADLQTNYPLMEELAARSGGRVFTPDAAGELAELLKGRSVTVSEHHEQKLWQWWVPLVVIVGLLTLEWVARKIAGLP